MWRIHSGTWRDEKNREVCLNYSLLLGLYFVTTEVFLGLGKDDVFAQLRAVLLQTQLVGRVHGVLTSVINALAGLFRDQTDQFALIAFFSHVVVPSLVTYDVLADDSAVLQ